MPASFTAMLICAFSRRRLECLVSRNRLTKALLTIEFVIYRLLANLRFTNGQIRIELAKALLDNLRLRKTCDG
jgi:hypothetical protein